MVRYDDIIHLPRPVCRRAKPLTGAERAAQIGRASCRERV